MLTGWQWASETIQILAQKQILLVSVKESNERQFTRLITKIGHYLDWADNSEDSLWHGAN
jgi:hypothetical protein